MCSTFYVLQLVCESFYIGCWSDMVIIPATNVLLSNKCVCARDAWKYIYKALSHIKRDIYYIVAIRFKVLTDPCEKIMFRRRRGGKRRKRRGISFNFL